MTVDQILRNAYAAQINKTTGNIQSNITNWTPSIEILNYQVELKRIISTSITIFLIDTVQSDEKKFSKQLVKANHPKSQNLKARGCYDEKSSHPQSLLPQNLET